MLELVPKKPQFSRNIIIFQEDTFGLYDLAKSLSNNGYITGEKEKDVQKEFKIKSKEIAKTFKSPDMCVNEEISPLDLLKDSSRFFSMIIPLSVNCCIPPDDFRMYNEAKGSNYLHNNNIDDKKILNILTESEYQLDALLCYYKTIKEEIFFDKVVVSSDSETNISMFSKHSNIGGVNTFLIDRVCSGKQSKRLRDKYHQLREENKYSNEKINNKFLFIKNNIQPKVNALLV
jgi:hypothetical protein